MMKHVYLPILSCAFFLFACQESTKITTTSKTTVTIGQANKIDDTLTEPQGSTVFLIDHCDIPYISVLERDITKGNDSCILRIMSKEKNINRVEVLHVPIDKSRIKRCEKDYVSVSFACGGPCHSHVFVFTDEERPNEQHDYVQYIDKHPNIIAHIEKEEFEKLIVRNLDNGKEQIIENSDINGMMNYGKMDTLYLFGNNLNLEYQTKDEKTKKKVVSLSGILNE